MSPLEQRVREAVYEAWDSTDGDDITRVQAMFVAFFGVIEDSFDLPTPDPEAPPVRDLPTEPGAVVLASEIEGERFVPPLLVIRSDDDASRVARHWSTFVGVGPERRMYWHLPEHITDWRPARVVPDDGPHAPVAALHEVLRLSRLDEASGGPTYVRMGAVQFAAREALKALGEWVPSHG